MALPTPIESDARNYYDAAGTTMTTAANNLDAYSPATYDFSGNGFEGGYGGPPTIAQSMNQYLNPYTEQVIDRTNSRMIDNRDQSLNTVGANANAASAFGGSRHGLVERGVYDDAGRAMGDMAAQQYQDRFNTAAQLGSQDIGFGLQGTQMDLNSRLAAAQHGLNIDSTAAQFGQSGEALGLQANQALAGLGPMFQSLANSGWNVGRQNTQDSMAAGDKTGAMLQEILNISNADWADAQNHPYKMLELLLGQGSGSPLSREQYVDGSTTSSSSQKGSGTGSATSTPSWGSVIGEGFQWAGAQGTPAQTGPYSSNNPQPNPGGSYYNG